MGEIHPSNGEQSGYELMEIGDTYQIGFIPKNIQGFMIDMAFIVSHVFTPKEFTQQPTEQGLQITRIS